MPDEPFHYGGFSSPRYTPTPDDVFDVLLAELSEAELKVLLYIIRRTFGFKKDTDAISMKQLQQGIRTRDGRQLDRGAGLSLSSIQRGIKGLLAKGIITVEHRSSPARGDETTVYGLRFRPDTEIEHRGDVKLTETPYLDSVSQETDESTHRENGYDPTLLSAIRTFAGKHRQNVTPEQVAALAAAAGTLARWQMVSAGAGSLGAVERALGEA
jgi:hypothetical protein